MKITCISDLHGHYPELPGGDLLIVGGDLTAKDEENEYQDFFQWIVYQHYTKTVIIAGNHDNFIEKNKGRFRRREGEVEYLCDSGTEFEGLRIWGSPWTKWFRGVNPKCTAFMLKTEEELAQKWALIPDDVDILVTHSPPYGILDRTSRRELAGSIELDERLQIVKPRLHVFGHIHEAYSMDEVGSIIFVNASHVNERYEPVNKPITITL